ncbi:hypothetical protein ACFY3G_14855 [Streptomyces phaeochromogenes]|uniref:hypothetical protein n=1 Tax=Streptomyces phaeochromogenes TaxID=1923 RepID=UPI0036C15ABF
MTTPEAPPNPFATHPNEDPDHLAARQSRTDFAAQAQVIRDSRVWSDDHKTEKLAELYQAHAQEVADAYERVLARRQARLDYLNSLVPSGPEIPEGTSPADRELLLAAFRDALGKAKAASKEHRGQLLAEAGRYGDESLKRAVLQHASDSGDVRLVNEWVAQTHGVSGYSDEKRQLMSAVNKGPRKSGWDYKDFRTPELPPEVAKAVYS